MKSSNTYTNIIKKISGILLIIFVVLLMSAFNEIEDDNLYSYQWGLKNNGNFAIDRTVLAENYKIIYHDKSLSDAIFQDDKSIINTIKSIAYNPMIAYAKDGFDIGWDKGYKLYKEKSNKRDVVVAIIDSGVDVNHIELQDNIWINKNEIPNNGIDDDNNGYVDDINGWNFYDKNNKVYTDKDIDIHGTHAAGTIVAKHHNGGIRGIAYDSHVKIMSLKVLGKDIKGGMSSVIEAIKYAKRNGANICNLSLGAYSRDDALDNIILTNPDMMFVVAAGNGANFVGYSLDEHIVFPATLEYDNVITVSNVCFDGTKYVSANYGSHVDVLAPGTFILSTTPDNNYGYFTGTSMAAPFVSAMCALIYSGYPNVPINMYKNLIISGAVQDVNLQGISKSKGIFNIYNTLTLAGTF